MLLPHLQGKSSLRVPQLMSGSALSPVLYCSGIRRLFPQVQFHEPATDHGPLYIGPRYHRLQVLNQDLCLPGSEGHLVPDKNRGKRAQNHS